MRIVWIIVVALVVLGAAAAGVALWQRGNQPPPPDPATLPVYTTKSGAPVYNQAPTTGTSYAPEFIDITECANPEDGEFKYDPRDCAPIIRYNRQDGTTGALLPGGGGGDPCADGYCPPEPCDPADPCDPPPAEPLACTGTCGLDLEQFDIMACPPSGTGGECIELQLAPKAP